jgi:hypothetical protein
MSIPSIVTGLGIATAAIFLRLSMLHGYWSLKRSGASATVIPFHDDKP